MKSNERRSTDAFPGGRQKKAPENRPVPAGIVFQKLRIVFFLEGMPLAFFC